MITRRGVSLAFGVALLVAHPLSREQSAATIRRVGILSPSSMAAGNYVLEAFKGGMRDLGWLEGQNVEYRYAYAGGDMTRFDGLVLELVSQQVEVIVLSTPQAARAAQRATKTIPILMAYQSNAVGNGLVTSLARPGGNITGISNQNEEVLGKLVKILHEVTPGARSIAIVLNATNPSHVVFWAGAQRACAALDLVAIRVVASAPAQFGGAVQQIAEKRAQAIVVVSDGMYYAERAKLQELMQTTRLPVAYGFREHVVAGRLLSYAADLPASYRYAAKYVDKILKGAKPSDLPVEQPTKFELVVNVKTAKALGITIPQTVLLRADEVIQ